jgi:hypothetical protein
MATNAYGGIQAGIKNLGLTLNTPSNNQQSAQRAGTYNTNQAGSNNQQPYNAYGAIQTGLQNGGLTYNSGPKPQAVGNAGSGPVPSGGGGGQPSAPSPYYDSGTGQSFGSYGDFTGAIDSAYNEANGILGQQEQSIRAGEQDLYTQATSPFDAQRPMLDQALQEGQTSVESAKMGVKKDEQNALSAARNLYQELNQAGIQRFGGSSSAGEFANQLLGREFQKNVGKAFETSGNNMQKLVEKGIQIKQNYDTQLQSLETQKQGALAQAKDVFRQRLDQINNTRLGLSENKAQLKLQALQQLRSEAMAISQQHEQFRQQLYLQSQAADQNLKASISQYRSTAMTPTSLDAQGNPVMSQFGTNQQAQTGTLQGGVATGKKNPYDYSQYNLGPAQASWTNQPVY